MTLVMIVVTVMAMIIVIVTCPDVETIAMGAVEEDISVTIVVLIIDTIKR